MIKIVVADVPENSGRDLSLEEEILGKDFALAEYACAGDEDQLIDACRDADAVMTAFSPFTARVIAELPRCQFISNMATGFSNVDLDAARNAGIRVAAIDEYCTDEVADHAVLLMLALSRRLLEYHERVQTANCWRFDTFDGLARMSNLTLGVIGFGRIGQAVARRASGFGMSLLAYDPYPDEAAGTALGARFCSLEDLFNNADIISLNCGLDENNVHLIDADAFSQMQKQPLLINCARGGLIDEAALVAALDAGQIRGAGLDVLSSESPDLEGSNLLGRHNVVLTPHVAFYSDASMLDNRTISTANVKHFFAGEHNSVRRYVT